MNSKLIKALAITGLIGAPMLLVEFVIIAARNGFANLEQVIDGPGDALLGATSLAYLGGWACTLIAVRLLRVTGDGVWARVLFGIQMAGLLLASCWSILWAARVGQGSVLWGIGDAAWPLSHLLMIVCGITIVVARRWAGWKSAPAFIAGLALPVFIGLRAMIPNFAHYLFPAFTGLGFGLLALATLTSQTATSREITLKPPHPIE